MKKNDTFTQYTQLIEECSDIFNKKNKDYGTSWRILRLPSITDQLYIKANRIRTIQEKKAQKVADNVESEFIGIINYAVMALIQIELNEDTRMEIESDEIELLYQKQIDKIQHLLSNKNHDYGEAWRLMRVSSITDIILMKLLRIKQIENHDGKTLISEGVEAGYQDIVNYAVFALILMKEEKK